MLLSILDNRGFLTSEVTRASFSKIESISTYSQARPATKITCTAEEIESDNCPLYWMISMISGGTTITITRQYKGWLETFGDIGGIKEVALIVAGLLYCLFHDRAVKDYMVW